MADITMCINKSICPLSKTCYRATATPNNHWQSYSSFMYEVNNGSISCKDYWPENKGKRNYGLDRH